MSLQFKLLAGSLIFAALAVIFAAFSSQTLLGSRAMTTELYQRGVESLDRLQEAQRYAAVLSERYGRIRRIAGAASPASAHADEGGGLDTPVTDIAAILREAAGVTMSPEIATRIDELLYPLSRLSASQGAISLRSTADELASIADRLDDIVSSARADVSQFRFDADAEFRSAMRRNWVALGVAVALGLVLTVFLSRSFSQTLRSAARQARVIAGGDLDAPVRRGGSRELRDVFGAIEALQAGIRKLRDEIAAQANSFDSRMTMHQTRFQAALNNMTQGLCMLDGNFNLVVFNEPFAAMFPDLTPGMSARQILADKRFHTFLEPDATGEFVQEMPDEEVMRVKRRGLRENGLLITFENITAQHRASQRLEHLAGHDGLTDLANRRRFCERLDELLAMPGGMSGDIAVICLDLNAFKLVNDTFGHPVGDELLRMIGARLRAVTGRKDIVARLGGDEFAVIQVGCRQPEGGERLAAAIVRTLDEPFEINGRHLSAGAAVGVVPISRKSAGSTGDSDHVMQNCDLALYRAKALSQSGYCMFEPSMRAALNERRDLELDLRSALDKGELELFYQPFVDAGQQAVSGFEALLRWRHPVRGMVSPGVFIPLAEEIGLIERIGLWTLRTACAQAAHWPGDLILSVNLSPVQFKSATLVADVRAALLASELDPRRLQLEVTESLFLDDSDNILAVLTELRSAGMIISMDDFGTGYSSLGYLSRFPFDKIKIDQSFVRDMTLPENIAIVRAVISLGKALKMPVIAEGIETLEQMAILRAEGCHEMQGYLFSHPRPAGDLPRVLAEVRRFWERQRLEPAFLDMSRQA